MTPHINAKPNQIAKLVLMAGDPNRAEWIASKYLKNFKKVTDVRGMLGFTGTYKNKKITVMGHGMGMPSIAIYAHELYNFYGVEVIYRAGSCGSLSLDIGIGKVIAVKSAYALSYFDKWIDVKEDAKNQFYPTINSIRLITEAAMHLNKDIMFAKVLSTDAFYNAFSIEEIKKKFPDVKASEMESYALFALAKKYKKIAACLLTVSDSIVTGKALSQEDRVTTFGDMIEIALEAIVNERI